MLKECTWITLGEDIREMSAIPIKYGSCKTFKAAEKVVLSAMSSFSTDFQKG